jgi:hypothetical protein
MDTELLKRIKAATPEFNHSVAEGLAVEHMMHTDKETGVNSTMAYVDRLIHINKALFPADLKYEGSQICTPMKHFEEITREYNSKRIANIAKSNTYLVKYQFSYRGEMLFPRYVLLPFVQSGGLIHLNGALYSISPVLTDVGYTVLRGSIFIPFKRTKLTFNKADHHFYADGRLTIIYVIWSMIHNEMNNRTRRDLDNRRYIDSCLPHYFFCKYGVKGTFEQWGKADIEIGYRKDFTEQSHPRERFTIFESSHLKGRHPAGDVCFVIPKAHDTDFVRKLVGGLFYVMDSFPGRFINPADIDNPTLWQTLLGHMVFGDFEHHGKVLENIETHLHGFDNSLDEMTMEELGHSGVHVSNIWELLYEIMTSLSHHFYQTDTEETSMYNKRLTVLRYVMEEFNYAISLFAYGFQSRRDKDWTTQELNDALKRAFKLNTCIRKLTSEHGELDTVNFPGDNKMFRITSMLVPQDRARKSRAHNKGLIGDTSRLLHASIAEVGQYKNQPKNNPDGRARINPFVKVGVDGMIQRRPEIAELIDKTQKRLSR